MWRCRISALMCLWAVMLAHKHLTAWVPNDPLGMLVFFGSAALLDLLFLYGAPSVLSGALCDDTQSLCLVSIVANFFGWLLYLAYASPEFYNVFMWGLGLVQSVRLLFVDSDDTNDLGVHMVRRLNHLGA